MNLEHPVQMRVIKYQLYKYVQSELPTSLLRARYLLCKCVLSQKSKCPMLKVPEQILNRNDFTSTRRSASG